MSNKQSNIPKKGCDVRSALDRMGEPVSGYTKERIRSSFDLLPLTLSECVDLESDFAVDVGCGGGFDSFALATLFDRVVAFDADPLAIKQARSVLKHVSCDHLIFVRDSAESFAPDAAADLIYCNLMSHNVDSRLSLLGRFSTALKVDGWLVYSEISEAYPAREIGLAIQQRDHRALFERLCQLRSGFTGSRGFRFFDSASLEQTLGGFGFDISREVTTKWAGLPESRQIWARRASGQSVPLHENSDYIELVPDFADIGSVCRDYIVRLNSRDVRPGDSLSALPREHRFFPFLYLLEMFGALGYLPCFPQGKGAASRMARRLHRWYRSKTVPWETLDELYAEFKNAVVDRENS